MRISMVYSSLRKTLPHQFVTFLLTGGLNTAFGYLSFSLFNFIIGNAYLAVPVSTIAGVLFNFKTYGKFVFKSKDHSRIYRFCGVYSLIIILQVVSLKWLFELGIVNSYLAVAIMILPMSVLSFLLMKRFVFSTSVDIGSKEDLATKV